MSYGINVSAFLKAQSRIFPKYALEGVTYIFYFSACVNKVLGESVVNSFTCVFTKQPASLSLNIELLLPAYPQPTPTSTFKI